MGAEQRQVRMVAKRLEYVKTGASGSARTYQANREARGKVHGWLRLIRDEWGRKVSQSQISKTGFDVARRA